MKLTNLLLDLIPGSFPDVEITSISCDSRQVVPGSLFIAIAGNKDDGRRYIEDARNRGAAYIISEGNTRLLLAQIACRFFQSPTEKFHLTGVTGTNGKTTITYLLSTLWGQRNTAIIGTTGIFFGEEISPATHTTPDAVDLQKIFSRVVEKKLSHVAMEVSSHALSQYRVDGCSFDTSIFTNLTQDHLDYHQNLEDYFLAKSRLFTEILPASKKEKKVAIVNIDDKFGVRLVEVLKNQKQNIITFGIENSEADFKAMNMRTGLEGSHFEIILKEKTIPVKTNLIGQHNISNLLASIAAVWTSDPRVLTRLEILKKIRIPGRLDQVQNRRGLNVFVDYAHTPDALENVLHALNTLRNQEDKSKKIITVFGCGGDRDRTKRPLMGHIAAKLSDIVIVTSDNPRTENPQTIIDEILSGQREKNAQVIVEPNRKLALEKAVQIAQKGDVILAAGKGHEDYQILGETKVPFDDHKILGECLNNE